MPLLVLLTLLVLLPQCKSEQSSSKNKRERKQTTSNQAAFAVHPVTTHGDYVLPYGEAVEVNVSKLEDTVQFNSIAFYSGTTLLDSLDRFQSNYTVVPHVQKVGQHQLQATITYNDTIRSYHFIKYIYHSDIEPKELSYQIVKKISHDKSAYIQGFTYYNNYLYEGTGHRGESTVRKIDPVTGDNLQIVNLDHKYFGEGIAVHDQKIYQITWQSQTAFIYNPEDLSRIETVLYDFREGWGLTSDGEQLIMSDGSAKIYLLEPGMLTELDRTEIYDHNGMVTRLNELEYVNGKLFANVYGKKQIVVIDPGTGKVLGTLDLSMLFPKGIPDDMDHVLNGIAYDPSTDHFYVTGKYWPVMYKIKITGWENF